MEFASEMVVRCRLARMRIAEAPTTLKKDGRSRRPHLRTWRDGWRHLRFLLIFSPRWLFFYPGLALLLFGAAFSILLLPGPVYITPNISLDIHTFLVSAVTILIGMECISFAVIVRRYAAARGLLPRSKGRRAVPGPPHIGARAGRCANHWLAWPRRHGLVCRAMGGCGFRSPSIRRDDQNIDRIDREHRFGAAARIYSISLGNYRDRDMMALLSPTTGVLSLGCISMIAGVVLRPEPRIVSKPTFLFAHEHGGCSSKQEGV